MKQVEIEEMRKEMSQELLEAVAKDFDDGLDQAVIIYKHNLNIEKRDLYHFLLPKETDKKCIYCGSNMYVRRRFSAAYKKADPPSFCPVCGHEEGNGECECSSCMLLREQEREIRKLRKQREHEAKVEMLENRWKNTSDYVDIKNLGMEHRLQLGVFMAFADMDGDTAIIPSIDSIDRIARGIGFRGLFPDNGMAFEVIENLMRFGVISICPKHSDIDYGFDENGNPQDFSKIAFEVNAGVDQTKDLIDLKSGEFELNDNEFEWIWKYIASKELNHYVVFETAKNHIGDLHGGAKLSDAIDMILKHYSLNCGLYIAQSIIRKIYFDKKEDHIYRKHACNNIIAGIYNYASKAVKEHWNIHETYLPNILANNYWSYYVYKTVLGLGAKTGRSHIITNRKNLTEEGLIYE